MTQLTPNQEMHLLVQRIKRMQATQRFLRGLKNRSTPDVKLDEIDQLLAEAERDLHLLRERNRRRSGAA